MTGRCGPVALKGGSKISVKPDLLGPVLPQDLSSLARALRAVPAPQRSNLCQRLFDRAEQAAAHVARTGQLHPQWGNGTLDAVARQCFGPLCTEPFWNDLSYIKCLRIALAELERRLTR
ncbi:hypothetical protein [Pseudophaeobacter arcticus]|uniref:DUF7742 family protein n=1 Tax=Pseudophaeobacter arcticus TaxID=385492 RepID=UPI00248FD837|nr:hypothetical protein [Pseudophaeobacter arcticus]